MNEDLFFGLVVVAGDACEQRFDHDGIGDVAALLHGLGEPGVTGDPVVDGARRHAEEFGQSVVGDAEPAVTVRQLAKVGK
jgi:hypothetical protein